MSVNLAGLLGLATGDDALRCDPSQVLRALSIGPFGALTCCAPPSTQGFSWCRITTLPVQSPEGVGPVAELLTGLVGINGQLRIRIFHQDNGIGLFLGSDDPGVISYARALLSPGTSSVPVPAAPALTGPTAGLAYRLQAETGDTTRVRPGPIVLDRLAVIQGTWTLDLALVPGDAAGLLTTRRSAELLADVAAQNLSTTRQLTDQASSTTQSAPWQRVLDWLGVQQDHLAAAGAGGGWLTMTWLTAGDLPTLERLQGAMRGALADQDGLRHVGYDLAVGPGGPPPISFLTSREIADVLRPPSRSMPGLVVRKAPPGHVRPRVTDHPLTLGSYPNSTLPAVFSVDDLEGHAFVTGTTGAGKTTTMHRLLAECWNLHHIPFLVIDPVKDDYSGASQLFDGGLSVITGRGLHLDIMKAWPGEDPVAHVTQIAQAFRGSFTMPSPTPYVVTQLFDSVTLQPGGPEGADLFDVANLLDPVIARLGYAPEATANIRAALKTRLDILLSPPRAHRFVWLDSRMLDDLFERPTVVTLADLVDDEERSFVVLILALAVWARARNRRPAQPVEHLLVLEEAHRVIPETQPDIDPESGSARQASAQLLSAMLTEVRSFGEQIIVVDQSPSKVNSDVLRNANLRIAHRIVHPVDQEAMAGAIGIAPDDGDLLGLLERGQAIVSTRSEPLPQLVEVRPAAARPTGAPVRVLAPTSGWPCGCPDATAHYRATLAATEASHAMALFAVGMGTGSPHPADVRGRALAELRTLADRHSSPVDCLAWIGLQRVTAVARRTGAYRDRSAQRAAVEQLWAGWHHGAAVPPQEPTDQLMDAIAECLYPTGVRTPVDVLSRPDWTSQIGQIRTWMMQQATALDQVADSATSLTLLRRHVHRQATRQRICGADIEALMRRLP